MVVLQILRWLLTAAEVLIALPICYLCVLSVSAIVSTRKRNAYQAKSSALPADRHLDFAILIPAHNEELVLASLLTSLSALEYPKDSYTVCVVADNCTDKTAELARATGVRVYERFDLTKRGKGYALNWLLQYLEDNQLIYDAYIVLDADSVVSPLFLQAMEKALLRGALAAQGFNTVLNDAESPSTALRWIALALVNHVRPLGRNGLGGSSTLSGNGMCLSRSLLIRYPWQAFGLAEDYQYYLMLVEHGERTRYVPEAVVHSQMPTTFAQMRTQDVRWETLGGTQPIWRIGLRLLRTGLRYGDFVRIEAVAELVTPPLSVIAGCCLLTVIASGLLWSLPDLVVSLIITGGLMFYVGSAFYLLHPSRKVYLALLHAPGFMLWKLWVIFVLKQSKKHTSEWVRTSRTISIE